MPSKSVVKELAPTKLVIPSSSNVSLHPVTVVTVKEASHAPNSAIVKIGEIDEDV